MLGLETKKNQERNVSTKEKESLIKLDELSKKIDEVKNLFIENNHDEDINELLDDLKQMFEEEFMTTRGTIARLNKKIDSLTEHYDKVLGSIYQLLYVLCLKKRIDKQDFDNGLFDELPDRLKGGDLNK